MRETKLSKMHPSKIRVLTKPGAMLKLNRCSGDEFAITKGYQLLYVFESPSLSRHLALEGRKKIRCVRLHERSTQHGTGAKRLSEFRYEFCDGRTFILDERDRIFALDEVTNPNRLHSPCGLWGLVPEEPVVHMLLTGSMVDAIEAHATEDQVEHVLRTYWYDWKLSKSSHPKRSVKIRGEFGSFRAKYINSKLVKFDTPR
ncbi:hypothetical protein [Coraliomargarita sinensis]|uniref:hypothetical protein n=1 Tax=Coraliomargarita sinensis TaxID=2174842 RepID=UPI0011B36226|nr:hypothetical protein [Coraliomargarita sinensis]